MIHFKDYCTDNVLQNMCFALSNISIFGDLFKDKESEFAMGGGVGREKLWSVRRREVRAAASDFN